MTDTTTKPGEGGGHARVLLLCVIGPSGRLDLGVPADVTIRELILAVGPLIGLVADAPDARARASTNTVDPVVAVRAPIRPPSPWARPGDNGAATCSSRPTERRRVGLDTSLGAAGVLDGDVLICGWPIEGDTLDNAPDPTASTTEHGNFGGHLG